MSCKPKFLEFCLCSLKKIVLIRFDRLTRFFSQKDDPLDYGQAQTKMDVVTPVAVGLELPVTSITLHPASALEICSTGFWNYK